MSDLLANLWMGFQVAGNPFNILFCLLGVLVGLILAAGTSLGAVGGGGIAILTVAGAVAISLLEVFVAFLQAFIFSFLTALFIGMSVNVHHDHAEEAHH